MYLAVTFSSPFPCIWWLIKDLAALVKSVYVFDNYWFILTFYVIKGQKMMICNSAFWYKKINFITEFLTSQDKKFHQIASFQSCLR